MRTGGADRQIAHGDGTHFIHLRRVLPDVDELVVRTLPVGSGNCTQG